ncbi:MAG: hypothetical protein RRZ24_11140 [Clostridia bacterium]
MNVEQLIKELIDEITGVSWSPGSYPPDTSGIKQTPAGSWTVGAGSGASTSSRRMATVETTVAIALWCGSADARADTKRSVMDAFTGVGFSALLPSDAEILLSDDSAAFVTNMTFKGWIDTTTYWVYQKQQ